MAGYARGMELYRRRQVGWIVLVALVAVEASVLVSFAITGPWWLGVLAGAGIAVTGLLFGWLTVIVDEQTVVARFGIGIMKRAWRLDEIARVEEVRNPWWTGWGIRWLPGRTVYNISGFRAVEFELRDGGTYRIGTAEPEALMAAIERGMERRRG